jgi:branched-chain amino acid transport system ATP-binding protein
MAERTYILEIEGVSKSFGGLKALDDVDFKVATGRITSLIGPNGAGKSTLFNLVSGIIRADKGSIIFNGSEISKLKGHEIARMGIARTFQNIRPFRNMNVLENVMVSHFYKKRFNLGLSLFNFASELAIRKEAKKVAESLLELTGLYERRFFRPTDLPYGSQRKLEIARGLALDEKILLLDEPFSGMTPTEASELKELVLKLKTKGSTIFLIEHNMNVVMDISEWIVVLNFGKKISEGTVNLSG